MKAYITVGISGSGKSTWSKSVWDSKQDYPMRVICRDNTRWLMTGRQGWNGPNKYRFDKHVEAHVTVRNNDKIVRAGIAKQDIIIADTNLNPVHRQRMIEFCQAQGYDIVIKEFPISFPEALRRDKERGIYAVGEDVLKKQWEQWVKYHLDKIEGGL